MKNTVTHSTIENNGRISTQRMIYILNRKSNEVWHIVHAFQHTSTWGHNPMVPDIILLMRSVFRMREINV